MTTFKPLPLTQAAAPPAAPSPIAPAAADSRGCDSSCSSLPSTTELDSVMTVDVSSLSCVAWRCSCPSAGCGCSCCCWASAVLCCWVHCLTSCRRWRSVLNFSNSRGPVCRKSTRKTWSRSMDVALYAECVHVFMSMHWGLCACCLCAGCRFHGDSTSDGAVV